MKENLWTKEQLEAAAALADELQREENPNHSVEHNMKVALLQRLENIDADEVVSGLCTGIRNFHENLDQAKDRGLAALAEQKLDEMLLGRSEEEQAELLNELLTAFSQTTGQAVFTSVEPSQIEAMRKLVLEFICEYSVVSLGCDAMERLIAELGQEGLNELEAAREKENREQYMALAFYLLRVQGELDMVPDELSPEEIGALTASALTANETILSALLGKIDWEKAKEILKMIAGVTVIVLSVIVAAKLALLAGAFVFFLVQAMVGMGAIGLLAGMIFGFATVAGVVKKVVGIGQNIVECLHLDESISNGASIVSNWLQTVIKPNLLAFWDRVRESLHGAEAAQEAEAVENEAEEESNYHFA